MYFLSIFLFAATLFVSCAQNHNIIPIEHQTLAVRLGANLLKMKPATFNKSDSTASFNIYKEQLNEFLKKFPASESNTPEHISLLLMRAHNAMDALILRDAPALRDSLDTITFFFALSQLNSLQREFIEGATLDDYIFAYTKYLLENKSKEPITKAGDLLSLLTVRLQKPTSFMEPGPGEKAYAFIRQRPLASKFNGTLSEKQKLLMKSSASAFAQSLSEKQAEMFRELESYWAVTK